LVFLLINMHSSLQNPLAFPGYCTGGKIQEDPEKETLNTLTDSLQRQLQQTITVYQKLSTAWCSRSDSFCALYPKLNTLKSCKWVIFR